MGDPFQSSPTDLHVGGLLQQTDAEGHALSKCGVPTPDGSVSLQLLDIWLGV